MSKAAVACNKLSVRLICQLKNDSFMLGLSEVIRFDESCYYVGYGNALYYVDLTHDETSSVNTFEGVVSIAVFSYDNRILLALTTDGHAIALYCQKQQVEFLSSIDFAMQHTKSLYNEKCFLRYDADRNILVKTTGGFMSISSVHGFVDDQITTSPISMWTLDDNSSTYSIGFWGDHNVFLLVYSSCSSDYIMKILIKNIDDQDGEPNWQIAATDAEVQTKHKCWITALSTTTEQYSDITASGDSTGKIIVYKLIKDSKGQHPLKTLLASDSLCEGNAITCILINPQLNDIWIGDISGAITSAHLSVKSRSLHPTRRLSLFGTVGGPSYLHWQANAAHTEGLPGDSHQNKKTKQANSGILSAFSPACGMLVECSVMESIEAIFRISPEPAVTCRASSDSAPEGDSKGKLSAEEVSALSPCVIDACALLPHLNLMAVTSARTRTLHLWDLHSGLLQHSIAMEERFCKSLAAFDAPVAEITVTGVTVRDVVGNRQQAAWVAAGYSNGKFVLISLLRNAPLEQSVPQAAATLSGTGAAAVSVPMPVAMESRLSRVSAYESAAAGGAAPPRPRVLSAAHEVDILDAVGPQRSLEYGIGLGIGIGGALEGPSAHYRDDDEHSDTSEVSLGRLYGAADGASDDDSVGVGTGDQQPAMEPRRKKRHSSIVSTRRTMSVTVGPLSHAVELATRFCPLPITDILFSTSGKFIAICHIKKVIVVYNNHVDAKKVSLRVSFDEMFCEIQALVPSELSAERERGGRDPHDRLGVNGERRDSDDRTFVFADASRRASVQSITASSQPRGAPETDEESLVLLLQSRSQMRLLDAIKGTLLTQFGAEGAGAQIVSSAAWDVPVSSTSTSTSSAVSGRGREGGVMQTDRAVTGICVTQDMRIFLFGGDSSEFRPHLLHDQHGAQHDDEHGRPQLHLSMSLNTTGAMNSRYFAGHITQLPSRPAHAGPGASSSVASRSNSSSSNNNRLDNLVQGVSINELRSFSPLACVWSLRRLALLRMQLTATSGVQVLRSEEYSLCQDNVRIVYASGLKAEPRMRNHRAVLVLSNGHIIVMHL